MLLGPIMAPKEARGVVEGARLDPLAARRPTMLWPS